VFLALYTHYGQPYGRDQSAAHQGEHASDRVKPSAVIDGPGETPPANPNPERDEWRSEQDLEAQQDMAFWAALMFFASCTGVVITGIGVYFVKHTLDETRKATVAAIGAAEAAEHSADSYKFSERAWIASGKVRVTSSFPPPAKKLTGVAFAITWENTGRTPAVGCKLWSDIRVVPRTAEPLPFEKKGEPTGSAPIGPGQVFDSGNHVIDAATAFALVDGQCRILLWGRVEYSDIFFPEEHRHSEVWVEVFPFIEKAALNSPDYRDERFRFQTRGRSS
jgi:hypothetical protein